MADTRERVVRVVSEVAQAPAEAVARANLFADLDRWDSLLHLNVVLAMEREFGIQFDIAEVTAINSVEEAVAAIERRSLGA